VKPHSSAKQAARRLTKNSRIAALASLLLTAAACLSVAAGRAAAAGPAADEVLSGEFRRAIKLLEDPAPERRAEGEKLIRAMGKRAVPQLETWIARSEGELDRARALLAELGGKPGAADELLAAARPFFSRALASAWERFHAGEYAEAKLTAEAVLRMDPDSPELWQLRRLVRQSQERLISKEILEPTLEFRELVTTSTREPKLLFRLVNRSRSSLGVRAERGILGTLQINYQRRFMDGSERGEERTVPIRAGSGEETIALEPGGKYEREIAVRLEEPLPDRRMVLRIRAVGKFQPAQWGIEEKNLSRTLRLPAAECWVVAPQERSLADVPLKKLESALFFQDINSFFTGGQLAVWAAEDDPILNAKLLRILAESLDELNETGLQVADALLEAASGVRRDRKLSSAAAIANHWRRWWEERRQREKEANVIPTPLPRFLDR
jgi:tetratricopeptide (TPR) repeat protein